MATQPQGPIIDLSTQLAPLIPILLPALTSLKNKEVYAMAHGYDGPLTAFLKAYEQVYKAMAAEQPA